jgi:hypothetical protein
MTTNDPNHTAGDPHDLSEEELRAQLEEQIKQLRVEDVLLQTMVTLVNLAGRRLTLEEEKDVGQAKLAIDAVRAWLPIAPRDELGPVRDALSQLQMLFVREAQEPDAAPEGEAPPQGQAPPQEHPPGAPEDEERAKARAKIWTPPGAGEQ